MLELLGRRALVTGGSRGIGAAIAVALAENGADVAISYERAAGRAQEIVRQIESKGRRGLAIQADGADPAANEQLVSRVAQGLGGLDILVNNAGTIREGNLTGLPGYRFEPDGQIFLSVLARLPEVTQPPLRAIYDRSRPYSYSFYVF
ncbi:SDR family NAD(P)-dependent oxidoreductase [Micromonosporaceae bacterium B7E4]